MKKGILKVVVVVCIFIVVGVGYYKKCSQVKNRDCYISNNVYYALEGLDKVLDTYNNMDDSNIEVKEKYYAEIISGRMIALKDICYLDRDNDKYSGITNLGLYLCLLMDKENYDKEQLNDLILELRVFNSKLENYKLSDKKLFIYELIDSKSELNEEFMKVLKTIEREY